MHEKKCATEEEHKKEVEEVCSSTKENANTQNQMCQIKTAEASAAIASTPISTLVTTATATTTSSTLATVVVVVTAASKNSVTEVVANTRVIKEPPTNYCNRRSWVTTDRMNELRRKAQEAVKQNKTFTIRGCFNSVRNALIARGWVEKLDVHRKHVPTGICQVTFEDLAQGLPKRKPGETRRQYIAKCERNIMSRFLEHMPIDFLWTNRKEKCDFIDQAKNPGMTINKFHRAPFTSKEGLCSQLKDFHWYYEEGTAEMYFPRCFNVWSPEELGEFVENFKLTACMAFVRWMVDKYNEGGFDAIFSPAGKIPFSAIDFAYKRCAEYISCCQHNDIDIEDPPRIWDHDWDAFLNQHYQAANENGRILSDPHRIVENIIRTGNQMLENLQHYWPQHSLEGYQNLWIIKPANKCRGRGIQLMDNLKKILTVVNPSIASKSRYVVQKYIERPLIIHSTKFDIRQWFLITNVQPLVVWMYKESYLRFSSQEYSLTNHHESVHLTNHAIQKKYTNGKRDKRLPIENMWDCYSFQAYLRQIGKQQMWLERIYPGMRKAIVGTMLASQENMDRRPNTFELFGADFMITEDFHPWLIEINSSPDLGATTSVTARMCPQCLEDVIKVVIDRRADPKADLGNFELIYRQVVPPTPAYMGLNLFIKGKQLVSKVNHHHGYHYHRRERSLHTSNLFKQRTPLVPSISNVHRAMPTFNATEYIEKCIGEAQNSSRSSTSGTGSSVAQQISPMHSLNNIRPKLTLPVPLTSPCPNLLKTPLTHVGVLRRSLTTLSKASVKTDKTEESNQMTITNSNIRHRSCGPRLSTLPNSIERNFKFIIKKCTLQFNAALSPNESSPDIEIVKTSGKGLQTTSSESLNKADKRLMDLLNRANAMVNASRHSCRIARLSKSSPPTQEPNSNANSMLRSQSCFVERKQVRGGAVAATGRRSGNDIKRRAEETKTTASNETDSTTQVNGGSGNKTQIETTSSIHAIGKGLVTWKSSKRQTATSHKVTTATGGGGGINTAQTLRQRNFNITRRSSKFSDQAAINRNTRC